MQCELLGATEAEHVQALLDLLTGLSGHPGAPINQRELTIKSQVSPFTELKLVQQILEGDADGLKRYVTCLLASLWYQKLPGFCRVDFARWQMNDLHTAGIFVTMAYL